MRARWVLLTVFGLARWALAQPGVAPHAEAEAVAVQAQQVLDSYCSDARADDVTTAAESVAAIGAVWAQLSAEHERSGVAYLLYWRGLLAQCLGHDSKALDDLEAFLAARGDSPVAASLVADAERRVRLLERRARPAWEVGPSGPLLAGGVAAGVAGGALAGLAGWQWDTAVGIREDLYAGVHIGQDDLQGRLDGEQAASGAHRGLVVGSAVAGVTSVALLVAGGLARSPGPRFAAGPWFDPSAGAPVAAAGVFVGGAW